MRAPLAGRDRRARSSSPAGSASSSRSGRRCDAFHIHEPLAAAGLVLVLMNVATIFPLWPGNVGLVQIAVALPLVHYGVAYAHGVAFGIGLQAIEASVGVGVGLDLPRARRALVRDAAATCDEAAERQPSRPRSSEEPERARARVPG